MAGEGKNDKDRKADPDKDYGLPKVEIKPIQHAEEYSEPALAPLKPQEVAPTEKSASPNTPELKSIVSKERDTIADKENKGNKYTGLILVLILVVLGLGGWFYYENNQDQITGEQPQITDQIEETTPPAPEIKEEMEEPVTKITLTEIRSRVDRPRYFVVVGSFINEAMAKDISVNLHQKEINTFLVYPYADIANYRLAIGHFESYELALQEIDRVKGGFKENLWVLKY